MYKKLIKILLTNAPLIVPECFEQDPHWGTFQFIFWRNILKY